MYFGLASPIPPRERLAEVVRQLSGIGGGRSLGFGPNRVRSLPDGVGQVLDEYLTGRTTHQVDETGEKSESQVHSEESVPDLLTVTVAASFAAGCFSPANGPQNERTVPGVRRGKHGERRGLPEMLYLRI